MKNKIRCQTCFNFLEFCPCGLPEREPYEIAGETNGILIPKPPEHFDEPDVVVIAIATSLGDEEPEPFDPTLADEVFASMLRHPSSAYTLIDEIERFLQEGD